MRKMSGYLHSMRFQMAACYAVSLFFLAAITCFYVYAFRVSMNQKIHENFEQASLELEAGLAEHLSLMDQMAKNIGYSNAMQRYLFAVSANEQIKNKPQAERDVTTWQDMYGFVKGIYFFNDRYHIYSNHLYTAELTGRFGQLLHREPEAFTDPAYSEIFSLPRMPSCFLYSLPIRSILYSSVSTSADMAVCTVLCDLESLTGLQYMPEDSLCAILVEDRIVASSRPLTLSDEALLWKAGNGKESFQSDHQRYLSYLSTIPSTGWRIVFLIPEHSVLDGLVLSQNYLFGLMIFGSLCVLLLLLYALHSYSRSIRQMLRDVGKLTGGRDGLRLQEPKTAELQLLSLRINEMLSRIEHSIEMEEEARQKVFAAALAQQEAEMAAYRSQINPHFLFNTLECMRSMACYYQADPIEQLVSSMADLFQYSLYSGNIATFEKELNHLRSYLEVMSLRYPGQYEFRTDIAPGTLLHPVPAMLLQPLAENSIKHGFTGFRKRCKKILLLTAHFNHAGCLVLRLTDNGCGMTEKELNSLDARKRLPDEEAKPNKDSIGIQNIFKRLKLYSSHSHMNFRAKPGFYTVVELIIPASRKEVSLTRSNS